MGHSRYSSDEIVARGRQIYAEHLRDQLEPNENGKFLVIDIETGEYEIGEDDVAVSIRAYRRKPEGARFGMRVGYETSGTIGNAFRSSV
jgi:hypothetical protein